MAGRSLFPDSSFWGSIGRRTKRRRDVIIMDDGRELDFLREEESEFDPQGDFRTTETVYSKIMPDGWRVSSQHVVAQCYKCGNAISLRAVRYCRCGRVICARDARYWETPDEKRYVCEDCYRSLRRKKILGTIGKILISPFLQRSID